MWQIALVVPKKAVDVFEKCLEPFVEAVSIKRYLDDWLVRGYSSTKPEQTLIESSILETASSASIAHPALTIQLMPDINWVAESVKGLDPISVGKFLVYGSYNDKPRNLHLIRIQVDAGEAFGTGHHATTKGCLLALSSLKRPANNIRMLDLGCGAGILAIAGAKLWKTKPVASDIDFTAVKVATKNIRTNKLHKSITCLASNGFDSVYIKKRGPFNLIVANILSGPLQQLAKPMRANSAPGATIILSGILDKQSPSVMSSYRLQGFYLRSRFSLDGWTTLILTSPTKLRKS